MTDLVESYSEQHETGNSRAADRFLEITNGHNLSTSTLSTLFGIAGSQGAEQKNLMPEITLRAIDDRFGKQHNQLGDISLRFYIHSPNQIENVKALSDSIMLLNINESAESERHERNLANICIQPCKTVNDYITGNFGILFQNSNLYPSEFHKLSEQYFKNNTNLPILQTYTLKTRIQSCQRKCEFYRSELITKLHHLSASS
ncbi:hypothetical protein M9H77_01909 [Catharanthus roseus]|uniref:Uncharacterized protein n=1 Tax=Catharanthus roseus TaxID=4058 RepID=A0ACC0C758_CATRO|nr:hypothetical protein M9H77_01909 [Catharanthus roseus]